MLYNYQFKTKTYFSLWLINNFDNLPEGQNENYKMKIFPPRWDSISVHPASPFHNWRTTTLQHFAIEIFYLRTTCRIRCTITRIRCICFSGRIKSHQNHWHAQYSDATKCDQNYRNATHDRSYERRTTFCLLARVMHDFFGRKTSRSCLCVCCATMRLLLNMLHVIVQRFTIIARFISFNLPCS